jgi:DNA-binding beta-propeller fold protein YncE
LRNPRALAWDAAGRALYVADTGNAQLRRIAFDAGGAPLDVHTLFSADGASGAECDGGGLDAALPPGGFPGAPRAVAFDATRRALWLADGKVPQLAWFAVDAGAPQLQVVPLPQASGPAIGVAIVGDRVFAVDAAGALSAADAGASSAAPIATLALAPGAHAAAFGSDGEWLYLADDAARLWRIDPWADAPALEQPALAGDGIFGVDLDRAPPGLNRPTGLAYDGLAGVLLVSDGEENSVVMIQ